MGNRTWGQLAMAEHPARLCTTCLLDGPCGASPSNTLGRGLDHCRVRKLQGFRKSFRNGPVIKCLLWGGAEFGTHGGLCKCPLSPQSASWSVGHARHREAGPSSLHAPSTESSGWVLYCTPSPTSITDVLKYPTFFHYALFLSFSD